MWACISPNPTNTRAMPALTGKGRMDTITTTELEAEMTAHCDRDSYPFWATREVDWKGRKVLVDNGSRQFTNPVNQRDEE